ncbi:hypothetical protein ACNKHV_25110 [Shigella flexneri]
MKGDGFEQQRLSFDELLSWYQSELRNARRPKSPRSSRRFEKYCNDIHQVDNMMPNCWHHRGTSGKIR